MLLPVQLPPPFGPPLLVLLLGPGHGQRVRGHILGDGGTRRDIGTRAHSHRRHHIGVAADEGAVLNGAAVLLHAVIVGGDGAAAEVDMAAHIAVPHIGEMGDLGAVADGGVLHLHEVAHLDVVPDGAAGAHVGKGPHVGAAADGALVHLGGIDLCLIADDAIPHHGIGTDGAAAADGGLPPQDGAGQEHGPPADGDPGVDIHRTRVQHPDARADVRLDDAVPEHGLQLGDGVRINSIAAD